MTTVPAALLAIDQPHDPPPRTIYRSPSGGTVSDCHPRDIAPLLAEAIKRIADETSVSSLFD